jgi:signal transduction histidine kinase
MRVLVDGQSIRATVVTASVDDEGAAAGAGDPPASVATEPTPLALLSVEDSADDVELIAGELARNGLMPKVRQVQTSEEMTRALREQHWDAICMDYQMPRFDALRALKVRADLAPDTPVIVISGYIGETAAVALLKAGADDYIPKHNLARLAPALRRAMRDVGDRRARRQMEEERERLVKQLADALELRDEFLILASHELRTPLTALRLQVESAVRISGGHDVLKKRLSAADQQIEQIARLIEDMITVSKLGSPEPIRLEETDLGRLVDELARSFSVAERLDALTVDLPTGPTVALVDPMQMEDALRRILNNAVKYGGDQPIEVRLECAAPWIRISVTDHGIGIAAENQARIFERFGRAGPTRNYGGLGLGLWIARQIVEAHGGTVGVVSRLGEGATFTVSVPAPP